MFGTLSVYFIDLFWCRGLMISVGSYMLVGIFRLFLHAKVHQCLWFLVLANELDDFLI